MPASLRWPSRGAAGPDGTSRPGNRPAGGGVVDTVARGGSLDDDAELIGRALTGEVAAYEILVRRYQDVAMRTAYLVAPEADAADAVQEAMLKAYAALSRFRTDAPFRPWLLRIVANEARNRRRSADRRAGLALRASGLAAGDGSAASPEAEYLAGEARDQLRAALARLRDEDREVIGARYFLGLSEAETAETLGLRAGTVKSRTSRALGRLREALATIDGGSAHG
jgi:RNA polymerase sigma factor (sigma-70 family)